MFVPVLVTESWLYEVRKYAPATSPENLCFNVSKYHGCFPCDQIARTMARAIWLSGRTWGASCLRFHSRLTWPKLNVTVQTQPGTEEAQCHFFSFGDAGEYPLSLRGIYPTVPYSIYM